MVAAALFFVEVAVLGGWSASGCRDPLKAEVDALPYGMWFFRRAMVLYFCGVVEESCWTEAHGVQHFVGLYFYDQDGIE